MGAKRRAVNSLTVKVKTAAAGAEIVPVSNEVATNPATVDRPN
jgi:hypothetical protein